MSGCPSYAHRGAGVHQARVSHLVGAPCRTTALAGPHRLMPVLVPAVVPLVPSYKANEASLHGAAFPTEPTLRIQASGVHDEAHTSSTICWLSPRLLTKLLTNRFDLDRSRRYSGGLSIRSAQLSNAGGSWLTRKRSLVQIQYRPPVTPLISQPLRHLRNIWRLDRLTCRPNFCRPIARRPMAWRRHLRARRWRALARDNWTQFIPVHALRDDHASMADQVCDFLDGHPELDSKHTKLCRNSRNVHSVD
jgi:hypothetical protein